MGEEEHLHHREELLMEAPGILSGNSIFPVIVKFNWLSPRAQR